MGAMYYHITDFKPYENIAGSGALTTSICLWDSEITKIHCVDDAIAHMTKYYPHIKEYKITESLLPLDEFHETSSICKD
jgi:hypothetical protein